MRIQLRGAIALAIGLMLGSCAEYQARRQQAEFEEAQAIAANEDAQCRSYGAVPGSQAYIQCRMNFDNQRAQMRAAIASQLIGRTSSPPTQNLNVNVVNCNANPALCVR
jgi:hypothetical protein